MSADRGPVYSPDARHEIRVFDVEYRHDGNQGWLATVYQPQGEGPFPALLDAHGGVWSSRDRLQGEPIDRQLAESGMVVVAFDYRLAPEHPYPAQVQDIHYATRWLKAHAQELNADSRFVGGMGLSSGGHTILLSAMRPDDSRYAALRLEEAPDADARLSYVLALWSVLDPYARYFYAKESEQERLVRYTEGYFLNEDAMQEGSPQVILDRGEHIELPPTLIIQGTADMNIPMSLPENFFVSYEAAGGEIEMETFPGMPHRFMLSPGPDTDRAVALMKAFIAQRLALTASATSS